MKPRRVVVVADGREVVYLAEPWWTPTWTASDDATFYVRGGREWIFFRPDAGCGPSFRGTFGKALRALAERWRIRGARDVRVYDHRGQLRVL